MTWTVCAPSSSNHSERTAYIHETAYIDETAYISAYVTQRGKRAPKEPRHPHRTAAPFIRLSTSRLAPRAKSASPGAQPGGLTAVRALVAGRDHRRPLPQVRLALSLQYLAPRPDVGPPTQQRAPLPLRHAAPDAELDPVVQRIRQTLGANRAGRTHGLRPVLRRALDEQLVRVHAAARSGYRP